MFPGPGSFTGEDVVEFHLHGSPAVLRRMAECLGRLPAVRPALPGEFTRRAFLNGRLDLTQAEALADLIDAETTAQARAALRQLDGAFGRKLEAWRELVLDALAHVEALIDFGETDDVALVLPDELLAKLSTTAQEMGDLASSALKGERLRQGITVAVIGPPNAGKSSLVNALTRRDVAIVTAVPGTTRDVLEVALELNGLPVILLDTAGLRESDDPVEQIGIARARQRAAHADLRLLLVDCQAPDLPAPPPHDLLVYSKGDLRPGWSGGNATISCATEAGLEELEALLAARAAELLPAGDAPTVIRERHRHLLDEAATALAGFLHRRAGADAGLAAEELRVAMSALGRISGVVQVEDVLDRIFATFCIGK